jgi:hypothetical protein
MIKNITIRRTNGVRFVFDPDNETHVQVASRYLAAVKKHEGAPTIQYKKEGSTVILRTPPGAWFKRPGRA